MLAPRDVRPREVDRGRRAARGDALRGDPCSGRGRSGTRSRSHAPGHTRTHALQRVQRSRSIGFSCAHDDFERAEPAGDLLERAGIDGKLALCRKLRAGRASREEDRDAELRGQRLRPVERRLGGTDDQHAAFGAIRHARHRRGLGQSAKREQRGDLRRGRLGFGRPAAGLADVDEPDRLRLAAFLRDLAEQPRLLRARDDDIAGGPARERGELLLAQHGPHGGRARKLERLRERARVERHRAVARAKMQMLVGEAHRALGSNPSEASGRRRFDCRLLPRIVDVATAALSSRRAAAMGAGGFRSSDRRRIALGGVHGFERRELVGGDVLDEALRVDSRRRRIEDVAALHHLRGRSRAKSDRAASSRRCRCRDRPSR